MKEIIENIKKNTRKEILVLIFPETVLFSALITLLYMTFCDGFNGEYLFLAIICSLFAIPGMITLYKKFLLLINPFRSDLFKKYGDVEKITEIYTEIQQSAEYEDDVLIVSKNYICDKKSVQKLIANNDVLGIHKFVHKTNLIIDYYAVVVIDKYGEEYYFCYKEDQEDKCLSALNYIATKCKNAEVGYTQDELDHVKNNKILLKANSSNIATDTFSATFKSDAQKKREEYIKNKKRVNVIKGAKYFLCLILSILVTDLILMLSIGNLVEGSSALILLLSISIPISFLCFYFFVIRKESKRTAELNYGNMNLHNNNINNSKNVFETEENLKCDILDDTSYKIAKIISNNTEKFCEYLVDLNKVLSKGTYNEKLKIDKALDYVENLHLDDGQKKILIKMQFPHFDKYNKDIALYVNNREDISYEDTLFVLEELGFAVFSDGTVKW